MAVYILTVAGSERPLRLGTLNLQTVINGRDTMSCNVISVGGAYRPTLGHEAQLTEDGTPIFGGFVNSTYETGADRQPIDDIETCINFTSFGTLADWRYVTEAFAAGVTLKSILQVLDDYLTDYGVTLDPSQATGPTISEALSFDTEQLSSVLGKLTTLTGWVWEIDAAKTFRMFAPGSITAPSDLEDGDGHHVGDISVTRSRSQYFNRVIVKAGTNIAVEKADPFTGDGSEDTFELTYPMIYTPVVGRGYVSNGADNETLDLAGIGSGATWEYDPATNTITRVAGAPANGNAISITYDAQFPILVVAEDATEIGLHGIYETIVAYPDVFDKPTALALAESLLSQFLEIKIELEWHTYQIGLQVGQTITCVVADRGINGSFLITEVRATNTRLTQDVLRTVRAISGDTFRGSFRDVILAWMGQSTTGSVVSAGSGPPVSTGGSGGALIAIRRYDTPGTYTYTPSAGTAYITVEVQGAGGGGSGVASAGSSEVNLGGGGGGGAWLFKLLRAAFDGAQVIVGAAGAGGASGNNNGANGGDSAFVLNDGSPATAYTAPGGVGGAPRTSFLPPITAPGGAGGSSSDGDLNVDGADGLGGFAHNQFVGFSSSGGGSRYATLTPGAGVFNGSSLAGPDASGYGAGGSGATSSNAGGAKAGGSGSHGLVLIYEYR